MSKILVTGAAQGLGAAVARELKDQGFSVVGHYRTKAPSGLAESVQGDFSTPEGVRAFIKKLEGMEISGLVNNVGQYFLKPVTQTTDNEWFNVFQVNLHAPFMLINALLPKIRSARGAIVNIGNAGLLANRAATDDGAYRATKNALWHLTRTLAKELAPDGVTVNMVSPGYLENAIDLPNPNTLPMGRAATLKEAAEAVAFFLRSPYITGQNLEVAGGVAL